MIGWLATFRTAAAAHTWFLPWLGGAALVAFLAGSGAGGWAAWKIQDSRVARAELDLSNFQRDIAASTAATELLARQRQAEADRQLRERDAHISESVEAIPGRVAEILGPIRKDLRSLINAPKYDCLRNEPLPLEYLERLRRPGGVVSPTDH